MKTTMDRHSTAWASRVSHGALALLLALTGLLAACGGGGTEATTPAGGTGNTGGGSTGSGSTGGGSTGGGSTGSGSTGLTPYTLAGSGNPITVNVAVDTPRAVAQDVPLTGGSITATGADGSTYKLDIPANALTQATRITLTPVSQVSQLPMGETGSTPLGVQMEPSGLTFFRAATLTITPAAASAVPLDKQLFVQWEGNGQKLALAAPDPKSAKIRLQVLHFSGMGVVRSKGLDADIEAVRPRIGGDAERRIQSAIAEQLARERQRQLLGGDPGDGGLNTSLGPLLQQFRDQVVKPRIAAAGSSCAAGRLAMITLIGFERQMQLLGAADENNTEIAALAPTVAEVCMKEEFEICRDEHVLARMLPAWLGIERQNQLLGNTTPDAYNTERYVKGCLKFELDFFSTAGGTTDSYDHDESVQALKTRLQWNGIRIAGSTALQSMVYDVRDHLSCFSPVQLQRVGSTFEVGALGFVTKEKSEEITDFRIEFLAGLTGSNFKVRDDCAQPAAISPMAVQLNHGTAYGPLRVITASNPVDAWLVQDFQVSKSTVLATKAERVTYQVNAKTTLYYDDRWELRHTPGL